MPEQLVEGGGERRASLPQLFVTQAQPLIRRQTRQEGGSAAFLELIVDQRDKFGVIVGHRYAYPLKLVVDQRDKFGVIVAHRYAYPILPYFSFASAARPAANLLMIVPIGTPSAAAASA